LVASDSLGGAGNTLEGAGEHVSGVAGSTGGIGSDRVFSSGTGTLDGHTGVVVGDAGSVVVGGRDQVDLSLDGGVHVDVVDVEVGRSLVVELNLGGVVGDTGGDGVVVVGVAGTTLGDHVLTRIVTGGHAPVGVLGIGVIVHGNQSLTSPTLGLHSVLDGQPAEDVSA